MNTVSTIPAWQAIRASLKGKSIGFVPTMGHLHAGHLSLCKRSQAENDVTVVSIFVNPTQFNQAQDFDQYPRTLEQDCDFLAAHSIDYLFLPDVTSMYPDDYQVQVTETTLSQTLEGEYRPGHFNGMLTVVLKLFHLVQPMRAYFGEKDYQQLLLIQKMVSALFLPIDIVPCEIIRMEDGLACSSRNARLDEAGRKKAAAFHALLKSEQSLEQIVQQLQTLGFTVDYVVEQWQRRLGAVWLDQVRLIDNVPVR